MLSRLAQVLAVVLTGAAATGLAGCGSSGPGAATPPKGFVVYHDAGFTVSVPKGFAPHQDVIADEPAGSHSVRLSPAGQTLDQANTDILLNRNEHSRYSLEQTAENLRKADLGDPYLSEIQFSVSDASVTGARSALLVRESYHSPYFKTGGATGEFQRTWLMIQTKSGGLIDVVVVLEPERGATLNPGTVIGSVRLSS